MSRVHRLRRIGGHQERCLELLARFGPWRQHDLWLWDHDKTMRVLRSLVARGLVAPAARGFAITEVGRTLLARRGTHRRLPAAAIVAVAEVA